MIDEVKQLLNKEFEEIVSSSDSLKLLRVYSKLYLHGGQPKTCTDSQRSYFIQLQINGIMKAEEFEQLNKRTCKPKWVGLKFIPSQGRHFSNEFITDLQATTLLQKGILKESDFEKLPALYLEEKEIEKQIIEEEQIEPVKAKPRKPKTKK